jgi:hypothetical protein
MEWVYSKDAARGTVMALDAKDFGSGVFNSACWATSRRSR